MSEFPFFRMRDALWENVEERRRFARAWAGRARADLREMRDMARIFEMNPYRNTHDSLVRAARDYMESVRGRDLAAIRVREARALYRRAMPEWVVWSYWRRIVG